MGLETKKILVCDRCGESVEVDGDAAEFELARSLPDWIRLEGGKGAVPPLPRAIRTHHRTV